MAIAEADLRAAQRALQRAQAAYDKVKGNPDIGALPQSVQLQQATNAYEAAKRVVAEHEVIMLSQRDFETFARVLDKPPKPTATLRRLLRR